LLGPRRTDVDGLRGASGACGSIYTIHVDIVTVDDRMRPNSREPAMGASVNPLRGSSGVMMPACRDQRELPRHGRAALRSAHAAEPGPGGARRGGAQGLLHPLPAFAWRALARATVGRVRRGTCYSPVFSGLATELTTALSLVAPHHETSGHCEIPKRSHGVPNEVVKQGAQLRWQLIMKHPRIGESRNEPTEYRMTL